MTEAFKEEVLFWCECEGIDITDEDAQKIAERLIHKSDYMWEVINNHIAEYVEDIKKEEV